MSLDYDEFYRNQGFARAPVKKTAKRIVELLNPKSKNGTRKVLDLGAGDGRHSIYFAQKGFLVTAVDNSAEAISKLEEIARKQTSITPVRADLTSIEQLPQDQFDAMVCTYVIHHLSPEQVAKLGHYIIEHTMPGGYLALATFLGRYRSLVQAVRPLFNKWSRIAEEKGKTQTISTGPYDAVEVLLQKPN